MTRVIFFLFCILPFVFSAVAIYQLKEGEKLTLTLGGNIKVWGRTIDGRTEYIQYCGPTEKNIRCNQWVTEDGQKTAADGVSVSQDGTLTIQSIKKTDIGSYFSNDELERVEENADGSYSKTARSLIQVTLKE